MAIDSSGNVYLAGITGSFGVGDFDMVLVKYNEAEENGEKLVISGYDFLLFISVIGVITAISLKKNIKINDI